MIRFSLFLLTFFLVYDHANFAAAQGSGIVKSYTLEGGPIFSNHIQSGDGNFQEKHGLGVFKVHTEGYGNWGVYLLTPNSVDDTSVGAGYVTDPYVIPLGGSSLSLELSGGIGLVTGYQDYPVPLVMGEARLVLFKSGQWDSGLAMAALPYYAQDDDTGENDVGIVATTPYLSLRYNLY